MNSNGTHELLEERGNVEDDAVTNHADDVVVEDARGKQVKGELLIADLNGVTLINKKASERIKGMRMGAAGLENRRPQAFSELILGQHLEYPSLISKRSA